MNEKPEFDQKEFDEAVKQAKADNASAYTHVFKKPFLSYAKQVKRAVPFLIRRVSKKTENKSLLNIKNAKNKLKFYMSCSKEEILCENISEDIVK